MQHSYGNQAQNVYQRPGNTTSFAGQPAPPPYGGGYQSNPNSNAYASSASPPVNLNQQWAPPAQTPPPMQQWNQPSAQPQMQQQSQQGWVQSAASPPRQPQQQQQQVASRYNPNVYGAMPGIYNQGGQQPPSVPPRDPPYQSQPQGNMSGSPPPPPPPPKPGQFQGGIQQPQHQSQQSWSQQQGYSSQPPTQHFQTQTQNTGFNQQGQGQQGAYPNQQPTQQTYNATAPPPPSQTPGGSYFPPTQGHGFDSSGSYTTPASAIATSPPNTVLSPNEQNPIYIPPSLSGQGVTAYIPANTNPLPGIYVPPPPDVPAWTQAQHAPLQPGVKKFRYTKPSVQSGYQTNPQQGYQGGMGMQQSQFAPQQPMQMQHVQQQSQFDPYGQPTQNQIQPLQNQIQPVQNQMQQQQPQQFGASGQQMQMQQPQQPLQQQQQQQQQFSQPLQQGQFQQGPQQSQQYGQAVQPAQMQQPTQQYPTQGGANMWNAQQQGTNQGYGAQPVQQQQQLPQQYDTVSPTVVQQGWQAQNAASQGPASGQGYAQGGQNQPIQAPKPVHGQLQATQQLFNAHTEQQSPTVPQSQPVSPIQQRHSMSFSPGIASHGLGRTSSVSSVAMGRVPALSAKSSTPVRKSPSPPPVTSVGASVLGLGGPSDWEHFGSAEDEIDDTEVFGAKSDSGGRAPSPQQLDSVELPTQPSPPLAASSSAVSLPEEDWPTPPAPAPLNINRPASGFQHGVSSQDRYAPTPPPKAPEIPLPHGPDMHEAPVEKSPDTTRWQQQWPSSQETQGHQYVKDEVAIPPATTQALVQAVHAVEPSSAQDFVMDDGGWVPPIQQSGGPKAHQEIPAQRQPSPPAVNNFVMNDGGWTQASQSVVCHEVQGEPSHPKKEQTTTDFVMDDGGWKLGQSSAGAKVQAQDTQRNAHSRSPQSTGSFAVHDGDWTPQTEATTANKAEVQEPPKKVEPPQPQDLIPGVDPWYASSLERYIAMLRQEAAAAAIEDKIKIFTDFLAAESQTRGIEYHRSAPAPIEQPKIPTESVAVQTVQEPPAPAPAPAPIAPRETPQRPEMTVPIPSSSFIMETGPQEYSPGGRPILTRRPTLKSEQSIDASAGHSFTMSSGPEEITPVKETHRYGPPSPIKTSMEPAPLRMESPANAAYKPYPGAVVGGGSEPSIQSTTILTPTSSTSDEFSRALQSPDPPIPVPAPAEQPQPLYKPYTPGEATITSTSTTMEHRQSLSHKQSLSFSVAPLQVSGKRDEIFFSEPERPQANTGSRPTTSNAITSPVEDIATPINVTRTSSSARASVSGPDPIEILSNLLPSHVSTGPQPPHARLSAIQNAASAVPADFSYITTFTRTWETEAAARRSKLDAARRARQEESEARTDELFNDNEISYADIGALEDEFKVSEAKKKAQEDRDEYRAYVEAVFDPVYDKLQGEIKGLMELFVECEALVKSSVSGKAALDLLSLPSPTSPTTSTTNPQPPPPTTLQAMDALRQLHDLIEQRHERVVQAVADRDRRYKRTEIQPLYAAGNIAKMKSVERHFDNAERQAALRARGDRADRFAHLLHAFEDATVRAVADDQGYRDAVVGALERVGVGVGAPAEGSGVAERQREVVARAGEVLRALARSSTLLMTLFNGVEVQLNDAVFEAEIAQARAKGAKADQIAELEVEMKDGTLRLQDELKQRLQVLEDGLREAEELVERCGGKEKAVTVVGAGAGAGAGTGAGAGGGTGTGIGAGGEEAGRQARMKAALEEAKRRNGQVG
ncbi:hypothetical protein AOQ84DRAFT_388501 [Glonium stellatum]|uniref:Uncharacterized protein n=1 Tax=Glonium stellatum TaxID=574774 RepID=A0A8E2F2X0_9PEZI|nr:hypothetical protein AOQ84DRAFT_388501 [Glonium stellatum]